MSATLRAHLAKSAGHAFTNSEWRTDSPWTSDAEEAMQVATSDDRHVLGVYQEVCRSYHAVDDFRMKLLGILPVTSLVGIFGLSTNAIVATEAHHMANRLAGFIGTFAAIFTAALFIYEIRGILRCSALIRRGQSLETRLGVHGQFCVCVEAHETKRQGLWLDRLGSFLDAKLAACLIYSSVMSAWVFTGLHFGMGWEVKNCALTAGLFGIVMGIATFLLVRRLVAA